MWGKPKNRRKSEGSGFRFPGALVAKFGIAAAVLAVLPQQDLAVGPLLILVRLRGVDHADEALRPLHALGCRDQVEIQRFMVFPFLSNSGTTGSSIVFDRDAVSIPHPIPNFLRS